MPHVVSATPQPFLAANGALEVHLIPAAQDNLIWLVVCLQTREAAVFDGPDAEALLAYCDQNDITLTKVFNTHVHADHIGLNRDLQRRGLLDGLSVFGQSTALATVPGLTHPVEEGSSVSIGAVSGTVLSTDGHIDGHVSYLFEDLLFCGDTLFTGGCGYLFDGPAETLYHSLMRLSALPDATKVCCGHEYTQDNLRFAWTLEPDNDALAERIRRVWDIRDQGRCAVPSRMSEERATNPFLRPSSPMLLHVLSRAIPSADLSSPEKVFAATRTLKDSKRYRRLKEEALPL